MTLDEIGEILEKVKKEIRDYRSYHTTYMYGDETWGEDGVSLEVFGYSSQGDGAEWLEHWHIYTDGKIYASEQYYDNFEEFERSWV